MSRLPKIPTASGLPAPGSSIGLPTPNNNGLQTSSLQHPKKRTISAPPAKVSTLKELTPEQEAILQEAMEKFNPEITHKNNNNQNTNPIASPVLPSISAPLQQPLNSPSGQLRKPGSRKQSMSRATRPVFPSLSEMPPLPTPLSTLSEGRKVGFSQNNSFGLPPPGSTLLMRNPSPSSSQTQLSSPATATPPSTALKNTRVQALTAPPPRPTSPSLALYSVGERVTVESMNITGTLRYLGPLNIKPGTWAGIELDVPGTGKNDGNVNGFSYFTCPPKTGIFVLATKLSKSKQESDSQVSLKKPPLLSQFNKNTSSISRPPSTSSNASDTHSPAQTTPALTKHAQHAAIAASRITAGSRASKYIGVTASQLKQKSLVKPAGITQPLHTSDSNNCDPPNSSRLKPSLARPSTNNLKSPLTSSARVNRRRDSNSSNGSAASGVSQQAYQSPHSHPFGFQRLSRAPTPNEQIESQPSFSDSESPTTKGEMTNKSLQEKIQKLLSKDRETIDSAPLNMFDQQALRIQQLQMKIEVLESENTSLKMQNNKTGTSRGVGETEKDSAASEGQWDAEKKKLNEQISQLTNQLEESHKGHHHRPSTSLSMLADEDIMNDKVLQLTELIEQKDASVKSLEESLSKANLQSEEYQNRLKGLEQITKNQGEKIQELIASSVKKSESSASEAASAKRIAELEKLVDEKALEIGQLVIKLDQAQVVASNLKSAGQETINIYEEKVAALSQQIEDLKKAGSETIALYDSATVKLDERETKINTLEREAEELRSAGVEAIDVYEKTIEDFKKEMEEVKLQLSKKEEALVISRKELETLRLIQKELTEAKSQLEIKDKCEEGLRNQLIDLQTGLEHMMRADAKSREQIYHLKDDIKESQSTVSRQLDEITALKNNVQELMGANPTDEIEKVQAMFEDDIKRLQEELENSRKSLSEAQLEKRAALGESNGLRDEKSLLDKKMQDNEQKKSQLEEELNGLRKILKEKEDKNYQLGRELEDLNLNLKELEETKNIAINRSEEEKEKLNNEIQNLKTNITELEESTNNAVHHAEEEKSLLRQQLKDFQEKTKELEDSSKSAIQQANEEKAALTEARNATLKNIDGIKIQLQELAAKARENDQLKESLESKSAELKELSEKLESLQIARDQLTISEIECKNFENELDSYRSENKQFKELMLANSKTSTESSLQLSQEIIDKLAMYEEQVSGLKHIIHELTRENVKIAGENKKILSEQEKLAEAHKQVENECFKLMDELERLHSESLSGQGILVSSTISETYSTNSNPETPRDDPSAENSAEEDNNSSPVALTNPSGNPIADLNRLQSLLTEKQTQLDRMSSLHNSEIRELRQKVNELEKSKQREVNTLTKDVAELESLVESKIFREADLEEEVQRERQASKRLRDEIEDLKEHVREMRNMVNDDLSLSLHTSLSTAASPNSPSVRMKEKDGEMHENDSAKLYCEICEEEGHDIIHCKAVFGADSNALGIVPLPIVASNGNISEDRPYCENCEEYGRHSTEDCPNQDETF
ncbi:hypothetical protein G9A89_001092 [Geosiphon pyriformis]|nr:hypothetical protein G9A89_001092 [Geosiphon pyriformis]